MKTLMKLLGAAIIFDLEIGLLSKLSSLVNEQEDCDFDETEYDDICDDCDAYPGYGDAIQSISHSDMFSVHKREVIENLPLHEDTQFYRGIQMIATSDMFSVSKKDSMMGMIKKSIQHSRRMHVEL